MSQPLYNPIQQDSSTIPMENYCAEQPRITAPISSKNSGMTRRTKVIIAVVVMTILWLVGIGVYLAIIIPMIQKTIQLVDEMTPKRRNEDGSIRYHSYD